MIKTWLKIMLGAIVIVSQIIIFRNFLPIISNKLVVNGQSCTCPDASIVSGSEYLKSITPTWIKRYMMNYSEVYFENPISTASDPMGTNRYIVVGKVTGKRSISPQDIHFYPVLKIDNYYDGSMYIVYRWLIISVVLIQALLLLVYVKRKKNA